MRTVPELGNFICSIQESLGVEGGGSETSLREMQRGQS